MSESSLPIDHAWSVVKGDEVEKAVIVPLAFGALGAGTGSGYRFINPETGKFDPGFHADAAVYDPITGAVKVTDLGDSDMDRAIGFGTGALQAVNPMTYLGYAGRGLSTAGKGIRTSDRFADTVRVADGVTDTTAGPMQVLGQGAGRRIEGAGQGVQRFAGRRSARVAGRLGQAAGNAYAQLGPEGLAPFLGLGNRFMDMFGQDEQDSGFGQQGQTQGFGSGGLGINDISNVQGNAVADRQIWNPDAYRSDPRAAGFEAQQEFGGFGIGKGETMFGENTGDKIKKQVEEMFYKARCAGCAKPECIGKETCPYGYATSENELTMKAKCPGCGKENCVNKMGCTAKAECPKCGKDCKCDQKNKADDDKKRPAHGMVIVIGSKAGPGPSKDGKREKLDSEKKED